jgi:diacylglycerol kinase (ATP)
VTRRFRTIDRLASFGFAAKGLRRMLAEEHNARIHLAATLGVVAAAVLFDVSLDEWRWLLLAIALVWSGEAFNTAVERLGDAVSTERNARVGAAKDMAAAAVLVASIAAGLIGLTIFVPHVIRLAAR